MYRKLNQIRIVFDSERDGATSCSGRGGRIRSKYRSQYSPLAATGPIMLPGVTAASLFHTGAGRSEGPIRWCSMSRAEDRTST